jgi:hypothetical protein
VALLASGCLRFRGDLSVSADERVSGTLVIALKTTDQPTEDDLGSGDLPADLQDKVSIEPYDQDGYQGSTVTLKGLTFAELDRLFQDGPDQAAVSGQPSPGATTSPSQGVPTTSLSMRRDGDRVVMIGQFFFPTFSLAGIDPADEFEARMRITFPGDVTYTNGQQDGRTVTWTLHPSTVELIQATAYLDASGGSAGWLWWGGGAVLALLLGLLGLVLMRRRRHTAAVPASSGPDPYAGGMWPSPAAAGQPWTPPPGGRPDDWIWARPDQDGPVGLGTPPPWPGPPNPPEPRG